MAKTDTGTCEHCKKNFSYELIHNGFNSTSYAYCDSCGCTAFFNTYGPVPKGVLLAPYKCINKEVESFLKPCKCGGHFLAGASPRCPHCKQILSAEIATSYIEANAPGKGERWRWQRNWIGGYSITVEKKEERDPWISSGK